ncbi:prolipoprotein diacylglyceryl transferase [Catenuloplanes atrovinosus]|uniref:Phosphatidylglycerol--prolipoprotein diacylglyceryl transferase n=1 Tax=Catenuloplanes atrovinosus TaxID=137266 RepID=A0AAE3YTG9_9ACTN|nr:prolipoprotein diacylglyceryl transferase [Catenuloplanes atrovinosus]MDR7278103.1 prolipoprotein diacylglyceryl transferase [Catenuloplanes atrovinosus]
MIQAAIPSPSVAVWHVAGFPIRAYALCIVAGIVAAVLITEYRLRRRGAAPWVTLDVAVWAVPAGIIGARVYHVITSPQAYFGEGGEPIRALYVWEGGLGIWGAIAGGAVGAWFACRQYGIPLRLFADALAPGLPVAQAIGRLGNWWNNELYGGLTTLPWGLEIHKMDDENPGRALLDGDGNPILEPGLYHPTFLYELIWNLGVAGLVLALDRRFKFGRGRAFALYVMGYTVGRFWIEMMRTDPANAFFGVRLNVFTSVVVFAGALAYFLVTRGPREFLVPVLPEPTPAPEGADEAKPAAPAAPTSYRVVTEEQFEAYRQTGAVPPPAEPPAVAEPAPAAPEQADAPQPVATAEKTEKADADAAPAAPGGDEKK